MLGADVEDWFGIGCPAFVHSNQFRAQGGRERTNQLPPQRKESSHALETILSTDVSIALMIRLLSSVSLVSRYR